MPISEDQKLILNRMAELERNVALLTQKTNTDSDLLYSTMVKVRADSDKIDEKARRIAWIGIGYAHRTAQINGQSGVRN